MTTSHFDTASAVSYQDGVSKASRDRYSRVAIVLHWTIAAFIIFNLCTGFFIANWLPAQQIPAPLRWMSLMLHVSSGLTVLTLTVARSSGGSSIPAAISGSIEAVERHTAHLAHFLLYAAMVLMPLTGWAILSAHPPLVPLAPPRVFRPPAAPPAGPPRLMKVWNLFPMPVIAPIEAIGKEPGAVAAQHVLHEKFAEWHGVGGYLLLGC